MGKHFQNWDIKQIQLLLRYVVISACKEPNQVNCWDVIIIIELIHFSFKARLQNHDLGSVGSSQQLSGYWTLQTPIKHQFKDKREVF